MEYKYTAYYKTDEERIIAIKEEILSEYPNLGDLAIKAAKLETPFGRVHEDYDWFSDQENHINRLIDIVIVTEGKPEYAFEYEKACEDLEKNYRSWQNNYTYASPEDQIVSLIMQRYYEHKKDKSMPLITYKEACEIKTKKYEEERRLHKWKMDHTMKYDYTAYYKTDEERIMAISDDILREYPKLGDLATEAAKLETPFVRVHEDYDLFIEQENHINRLIDIIIVTEGKPEYVSEYEKACGDLEKNYHSWGSNYTYASPEEQIVYLVMQRYYEHKNDKGKPLITYKEAQKICVDRIKKKELDNKANNLRRGFPGLGEIADEVVRIEEESRLGLRFQENDLIRLVLIVKLTENKEKYQNVYIEALKRIKDKYEEWLKKETYYIDDNKGYIIEMMKRLRELKQNMNLKQSLNKELLTSNSF